MPVIVVDPWQRTPPRHPHTVPAVEDLVGTLDAHRAEDTILVCAPGDAARHAQMARAVVGRANVGVLVLDPVPTRRWIVEQLLSMLPVDGYRYASSIVDATNAAMRTSVVTTSVAGFTAPRPRLAQHLRSWFPGACFEVDLHAKTVRSSAGASWDLRAMPLVAVAQRGNGRQKVTGVHWPAEPFTLEGPPGESPWPAKSWFEVSALTQTPHQIFEHVRWHAPTVTCSLCHRLTGGAECIFCGVPVYASPAVVAPANPVIEQYGVVNA